MVDFVIRSYQTNVQKKIGCVLGRCSETFQRLYFDELGIRSHGRAKMCAIWW